MIVLFNVKISNSRFYTHDRPNLQKFCRADIFKYSIASHAIFSELVSKYIFFIELDSDIKDRKNDIEKFIKSCIDNSKINIYWSRINTVEEWRMHSHLWNNIADDIIWFSGNDDHIFMDYNLDLLESALNVLQEEKNNLSAVYYSHWPEAIRMAFHHHATLHQSKDFVVFDWQNHDAIRIVTKKLFNYYWFETAVDLNCLDFYRTDAFNFSEKGKLQVKTYVPTREMCRHFDGYSHVGGLFNYFPPLEIPNGFFESEVVVNYGYDAINTHVVNINPRSICGKCIDGQNGHDMWVTKDRLPLFWCKRIKNINSEIFDESKYQHSYKKKIVDSLKHRVDCHWTKFDENYHPPEEWILKHLPKNI